MRLCFCPARAHRLVGGAVAKETGSQHCALMEAGTRAVTQDSDCLCLWRTGVVFREGFLEQMALELLYLDIR